MSADNWEAMGSHWLDVWRNLREQRDPDFDKARDVKTTDYPNYDVIQDYNHRQEVLEGAGLLVGPSLIAYHLSQ